MVVKCGKDKCVHNNDLACIRFMVITLDQDGKCMNAEKKEKGENEQSKKRS